MKKSAWGLVLSLAALGMLPAAQAGEGVLVEKIPANVDKAAAVAAAKDSLNYREWTVVAEDADSVTGTISRTNVTAKIKIKVQGRSIVYEESATGRGKLDFTGRVVPSTTSTPSRWLEYLRSDTTERLMARSAAPPEPARASASATPAPPAAAVPASGRNSVQRLAELKEMFDRGLISADEYGRKKDEILKAL